MVVKIGYYELLKWEVINTGKYNSTKSIACINENVGVDEENSTPRCRLVYS